MGRKIILAIGNVLEQYGTRRRLPGGGLGYVQIHCETHAVAGGKYQILNEVHPILGGEDDQYTTPPTRLFTKS